MLRLLTISLLLVSFSAQSQSKITWEDLEDVTFSDLFIEDIGMNYRFPHFGPSISDLAGMEVYIEGFMLTIDPEAGYYVLSKTPYAECFFCGRGGPETVVELKLKADHPNFKMDDYVTMKGTLKLNGEDVYQCHYVLQGAELY